MPHKYIIKTAKNIPRITEQIISDLSRGIYTSISSTFKATEASILEISKAISKLGKTVHVVSKHLGKGVNLTAKNISENLGKIIRRVPIAGRPAICLIKGAQRGIYYVVISITNLVGFTAKTIGRASHKTGKVIIFTLSSSRSLGRNVILKSNKVIKRILTNKSRRRRTRRKKSTRKR